jgi:hypothetical protein
MTRQSLKIGVLVAAIAGSIGVGVWIGSAVSSRTAASVHSDVNGGIGIPQLVEQVRQELRQSDLQREKNHVPALFVAKSVDLEIAFVVSRSDELSSRVTLKVLDDSLRHEIGSEQTQRMTLHLDVQQPEDITIPPASDGQTR